MGLLDRLFGKEDTKKNLHSPAAIKRADQIEAILSSEKRKFYHALDFYDDVAIQVLEARYKKPTDAPSSMPSAGKRGLNKLKELRAQQNALKGDRRFDKETLEGFRDYAVRDPAAAAEVLFDDTLENLAMKKELAQRFVAENKKLLEQEKVLQEIIRENEFYAYQFAKQAALGYAAEGHLEEARDALDLLAQMGESRGDILSMIEATSEKTNNGQIYAKEAELGVLVAATMTLTHFDENEQGNAARDNAVRKLFGEGVAKAVQTEIAEHSRKQDFGLMMRGHYLKQING